MPLSVQVALASQSPQQPAARSSSSSSDPLDKADREKTFSNHLEAETRGDSGRPGEAQDKVVDKMSGTGDVDANDDANGSSVDPQTPVEGGNESPLEDTFLPVAVESDSAKLLPAQSETLSAPAQQIALEGEVPNSVEIGVLSPLLMGSTKNGETPTRLDLAQENSPSIDRLSGNVIKPLQEGLPANALIKRPAAQVVAEALPHGIGSKEGFEQVRQNIMAAMAGKSEQGSSGLTLYTMADRAESVPQSLNLTNMSSTLSALGTESAKYSATHETPTPRFFTLQTPTGHPGWDAEVGNRIRWMVGQNNSGFELRLNPAELGSVEVKLATEGERTNVTFFAANPAAREALEAALPRLREMFADSGMQLANADVSDQSLQREREQLAGADGPLSGGTGGESMALEIEQGLMPGEAAASKGLIDYYI